MNLINETLATLTSNAWPSSISNVTTQKQVTHLLKRSQGKTGPSNSLGRNISSPSLSAIFFSEPSVFLTGGYSSLTSFPVRHRQARGVFWAINKIPRAIKCSKMASCSDGEKQRQISHSDELLRLPFKPGNVV